MKHSPVAEPELSRPLQVDKIAAGGVAEHVVARAAERKALAKRFDLLDLPKLEADLNVDHAQGQMLAVTGTLSADVVQQCVVSLEPVPTQIKANIDTLFAPAALLDVGANPPHAEEVENDAPEPIVNGLIDLGELVAQHLGIALDPYPRKQGVELNGATFGPAKSVSNPFAKLAELKNKAKR
jgi:uncharacterized metal-binding protein YceD (DUF177 family)